MKLVLIIVGVLIFAFGAVDFAGAMFFEFDLWGGFLGIQLPDVVWRYSAYAEMIIGGLIAKVGFGMGEEE